MNNFLIDTHVFLWLIFSPEKLTNQTLKLLADQKNQVAVSSISFWEISLKYQLGKLKLSGVLPSDLPLLAAQMNLQIAELTAEEFAGFYNLPLVAERKDPFDRMIIWQCISQKRVFISHDTVLNTYAHLGLNWLK
jgi:PIN domain nuclease of toxin-antitoxin system